VVKVTPVAPRGPYVGRRGRTQSIQGALGGMEEHGGEGCAEARVRSRQKGPRIFTQAGSPPPTGKWAPQRGRCATTPTPFIADTDSEC
jgi:hypothetical protein